MATNNTYFCHNLNEFFDYSITLPFISKQNIILVTTDDEVYEICISAIDGSILIFSNSQLINNKMSLFEEIRKEITIDKENGLFHRISRTADGNFHSWGINGWDVLVKEAENFWNFFTSEDDSLWKHKKIIEMSCGVSHLLVLTSDGIIYSWGDNDMGQIGNRKSGKNERQTKPYFVDEFESVEVKSISCGFGHSLALTKSGDVYSWGNNKWGQLGRNTGEEDHSSCPKLLEVNQLNLSFKKIKCGPFHNILLTCDEKIYVFGRNRNGELGIDIKSDKELIPIKLISSQDFNDIESHWIYSFSSSVSMNRLYYIWGNVIRESHETKSNQIYCNYFGKTFQAFEGLIIKFNENLIKTGFYSKEFNQIQYLGKGSFGQVFKVEKTNGLMETFAIKITYEMPLEMNKIEETSGKRKENESYIYAMIKELENFPIIKALDNEMIARYFNFWFENSINEMQNNINLLVYIKMELCDKSLSDFIDEVKEDGKLVYNERLTILAYYIFRHLFIQILIGLRYLHTRRPQIIHRDLNPGNILLKINEPNNSVVKIADMGLACLHVYKGQQHTRDRGNVAYLADEVLTSTSYDTRADIYSLGRVLKDLFKINVNRNPYTKSNGTLIDEYEKFRKLYSKMTQEEISERPESCYEILYILYEWVSDEDQSQYQTEFNRFSENAKSTECRNSYIFKIIQLFFNEIPYKNYFNGLFDLED